MPGQDLQDYILKKKKLTPDEAHLLLIQGALALAHAHDRGILHRDLKPANVLLTDDGRPMLLDWPSTTATRSAG